MSSSEKSPGRGLDSDSQGTSQSQINRDGKRRNLKSATFAQGTVNPSASKYKSRRRRQRKPQVVEDPLSRARYRPVLPKETEDLLRKVARELVIPGKGILAADDTIKVINENLKALRLDATELNRRRYHEFLLPADSDSLAEYLSGVLIREESLYPSAENGKKVRQILQGSSIKLGLRVDRGLTRLRGTDGELISEGLDKVEDACKRCAEKGAAFALWRCVYKISDLAPSKQALDDNSKTLARFALTCQAAGIVPIVSPEMHNEGKQDTGHAQCALRDILTWLVNALRTYHVFLEGVLVRISAAYPGKNYKGKRDSKAIAMATVCAINESVPPAIGGILLARDCFLESSLDILNEINKCPVKKPIPMSFCYNHVIHNDVINLWAGNERMVEKARAELVKRTMMCSLASMGQIPEESHDFAISNISVY